MNNNNNNITAIIDYKAGNAQSVLNAVSHLGGAAVLASKPEDLSGARRVILPGVGAAGATIDSLRELGLIPALEEAVLRKKTPFLGICIGLQILFEHSEEGGVPCLGWLKGRVKRFGGAGLRVPQIGWNAVSLKITPFYPETRDYFYFVNSYRAVPGDPGDVWGEADYGGPFAAAVCRGNIFAAQFHVEKSGEAGLALLRGFLAY